LAGAADPAGWLGGADDEGGGGALEFVGGGAEDEGGGAADEDCCGGLELAGAVEDGGARDEDDTLAVGEDGAGLEELTVADGFALSPPMLAGAGNCTTGWPARAASM
jgi:hypothetical protein